MDPAQLIGIAVKVVEIAIEIVEKIVGGLGG